MNTSEKYIARIMFQLKVHTSDGQLYENLFSKIMIKYNSNFRMIKPYGNIGDRKNDGFDKIKGVYYQVFAPENVDKGKTISDAISKLREDFKGLKKHWDGLCKIKEFYYVVNDKYKGLPPQVEQELLLLDSENTDIICNSFCSNNLETIFMELSKDDITDIIGIIPNEEISFLDFDVLNQAVEYLMNSEVEETSDTYVEDPDFEYKIVFNNLSARVENILNVASYQIGDLETYFAATGEYVKNELKTRFSNLYKESKGVIGDNEENYPDQRFFYILNNASPNGKKAVKDAVLVLMSFYFESCDIFEKPKKLTEV
ncbi:MULTISPECIES: ABC-three component system protein [unclassified Exiguobacterium]|uniref:ABC-three component system protein n=1 Tax=unclassified Exiguobacterium TaxID=2644629 RepID=UPI001BEC888F|nr:MULTISPECIES: ABC-three component system protein [unclassified Exiguobacterium]